MTNRRALPLVPVKSSWGVRLADRWQASVFYDVPFDRVRRQVASLSPSVKLIAREVDCERIIECPESDALPIRGHRA